MAAGTTSGDAVGIAARFDDAAARFADAPALRIGERVVSYDELSGVAQRTAARLAGHGVGRGSVVAISASASVELVASILALARLGGVMVMVSTAWRETEVGHALDLTAPTHLIHDGSGAVAVDELAPHLVALDLRPSAADDLDQAAPPAPGADPDAGPDPDEVAVVFFSSGTTGLPKAVRHTNRSLHHAIDHWATSLGLSSDDRLQIATPPFHILGLLNLVTVLAAGASARLHRRFDLDEVLAAIEADRVTIEMVVAPIALAMANHPELERYDLSSLRYLMWGATPVSAAVADTVTRRTGAPFLPAYGATELPVLAVNPVDRPDEWRLDSVGLPPAGVELRVVDLETGEVAPPGSAGEIQGRSRSVMAGYLPEEANAAAFDDGWYRTGDVGAIDVDGWVTITDRVKEMIKVNGFQVAPAEIEALLVAQPGVADCAVFGVPDPSTGEAVVAAVVPLTGAPLATVDELRSTVGAQLANYKRIKEIIVVDQIPRLPSGKVLRRQLQAEHGA